MNQSMISSQAGHYIMVHDKL